MAWPYPTGDKVSHLAETDVKLLRDRIDQLLEERAARELPRARLSEKAWPSEWKLAPAGGKLLDALLDAQNGRVVSAEHLLKHIAYSEDTDVKVVQVQVCRLRKALNPHGLDITTHWGRGYSLDPTTRAALEAL